MSEPEIGSEAIRDGRWRALGLLIARVGFGGAVVVRHGYPKIPALLSRPDRFFDPIGIGPEASLALAAFAELVCAIVLMLGLLGRLPAIPLVANFAVIVVPLHRLAVPGDRGELALLYLVAFSTLLLTGPGRYSLGVWLKRRAESSAARSEAS